MSVALLFITSPPFLLLPLHNPAHLPRCPSRCVIYDPEVKSDQIFRDMSTPKFEWDRPNYSKSASRYMENVQVRQSLHRLLPQAVTIQQEGAEGNIGLM